MIEVVVINAYWRLIGQQDFHCCCLESGSGKWIIFTRFEHKTKFVDILEHSGVRFHDTLHLDKLPPFFHKHAEDTIAIKIMAVGSTT